MGFDCSGFRYGTNLLMDRGGLHMLHVMFGMSDVGRGGAVGDSDQGSVTEMLQIYLSASESVTSAVGDKQKAEFEADEGFGHSFCSVEGVG